MMKRKLKTYLPFVNAGIQEVATYRVNWIFFMLGNAIACFVSYFIWAAVYSSGGEESMNGFTMPQMVVYIVLMFLTSTIIASDGAYVVGEEIRDGTIAMRLIKPVSYNATFLFQELGNKLPTEIAIAVPMIILVEIARTVMSGEVQFNVLCLLLYIISCVTAYLINFYFNICFGFLAFVIKYLWGANMMKNCIIGFLSGTVIPLSFLPDALERVFLFLPFASLNYTPVMIYMGKYSGAELCYYLGLQIFWALFFFGLSKALWKASVKRLSVQGG
ncbi:MAG: ABC-2 family transporter protein [Ruminococcus sp.]|nr:ABC-2 family transporter protein [Ruminococcus sp.]